MRWLARQARGWHDADDGATAVIVAIMLVVLFGMGALVLDVGNVMWERRMLQNSADAAALAAAQDLAVGAGTAVAEAAARDYASSNNHRGAFVDDFAPDFSQSTVTTATRTGDTGGGVLQSWLAGVIGHDDYFARAQATAAWGSANAADGLPFAVCQDLWEANRPDSDGNPGGTLEVRYKGTGGGNNPSDADNGCLEDPDNFGPGSVPGNFSWLDTAGGECTTQYDFADGGYTAGGDPGASAPGDCRGDIDGMIAQIQAHKDDPANDLPVRVVPVYTTVTDSGSNATYDLVTLAAFEFSGLHTSGGQNIVVDAWSDPLCNGAQHRCVQGRFVRTVALSGGVEPGFDSDVISVQLIR